MSLHISARPMGLVFCDRAQAVARLDKITYVKFKSAITLISRALTSLARRKRQAAS